MEREFFRELWWCGGVAGGRQVAEEELMGLQVHDFTAAENGALLTAVKGIVDMGRWPILPHVFEALSNPARMSECGGDAHIVEAFGAHPTSAMVPGMDGTGIRHIAGYLRRQSDLRRKVERIDGAKLAISEGRDDDADTILADVLDDVRWSEDELSYADLVRATMSAHLALVAGQRSTQVLTGWPDLDEVIGGLSGGQTMIVGGRPGDGKSSLGVDLVRQWAADGLTAGYISCEDAHSIVGERVSARVSGIPQQAFRRAAALHVSQSARLDAYQASDQAGRAWSVEKIGAPIGDVVRAMIRMVRRRGCAAIVVDYLQAIAPADPKAERRHQLTEIARTLKTGAARLGVPIVMCSQLRRIEGKPQMSHLREAGTLEECADVVLLLWRDDDGVRRAWVAKAKSGSAGPEFILQWDEITSMCHGLRRV